MAWEAFTRSVGGGSVIVSVDASLLDEAPIEALPVAVEVTIAVESSASGSTAEAEAGIEAIVQQQLAGRMVGRIQDRVEVWSLAYVPSDDRVDRLMSVPYPKHASVTVAPANDPAWTLFDRVRPVEMEQQSLLDHRVFRAMIDERDTGESRAIEHVVTDLDPARVDEFVGSVSALGHVVTPQPDGAIQVLHEGQPFLVTDDAWTIRLIAERLGGTYVGWNVELGRGGTANPKRRWFRRR